MKNLSEIVESVEPYLTKHDEETKGGREEIVIKINDINKRLDEIEQNLQKTKEFALEDSKDLSQLDESEKDIQTYIRAVKAIEGSISDLKYKIQGITSK